MFIYCTYYKCHKINPNRIGWYIDSPDWIKNKKATIHPINNMLWQLNYEEIKKDLQRITKVYPFIKKYNWDGIDFPSEKEDWKKVEKKQCNNCSLLKCFLC